MHEQDGDRDPGGWRDPAQSPYGLPWQPAERPRGPIALLVRALFTAIEAAIFVVLLPVRLLSLIAGRGVVFVLQLPFRILGAASRLLAYLVVAALILLVLMGVLALIAAA